MQRETESLEKDHGWSKISHAEASNAANIEQLKLSKVLASEATPEGH